MACLLYTSTYNLVILKTSFESIPESLIEAAQIDGAGHITILTKIVLPLSKAILAVMVLYYGVSTVSYTHLVRQWQGSVPEMDGPETEGTEA